SDVYKSQAEGVESSVGILDDDGYSFFVNGKSDGNVYGDRGTQIMSGLIGAALHPNPRTSLVVGLGTGCTAGWLSEVKTMERVDVVELEPAILHMAEICTDANAGIMNKIRNTKAVRLIINDAREVLNTTPERYDVIVSEPSNPYRAGIASMYTREFYEEVRSRLNPGGLFVSWCQAYEVDTETVFRILATFKTVFPYVECWNSQMADLVFVASMEPIRPDPASLSRRLNAAPFVDAMRIGWSMSGLEGFLSRFIATDAFIDQVVAAKDLGINTDDLMKVEYDYAKTVGRVTRFSMEDLRASAVRRGQGTPPWQPAGTVEEMTAMSRALCYSIEGMTPTVPADFPAGLRDRVQAVEHWRLGNYAAALQIPFNPVRPPHRLERLARAESLAWNGEAAALDQIPGFEDWWPASAAFVRARLAVFHRDWETVTAELERGYASLRALPWEVRLTVENSLKIALLAAQQDARYGERLLKALGDRFNLSLANLSRKQTLFNIALNLTPEHLESVIVREFEPNPLWNRVFLEKRLECYEKTGNPLAARARKDLDLFNDGLRQSVEEILREGGPDETVTVSRAE
ncbi:MAG: fused MFS/spermidine synthase, partial [Planctomycetaceae bacterium]|nr:fused MFS/spermidine synthase [Planctomycetaceae bacterium]